MSRLAYAVATTLAAELFTTAFVGLAAIEHAPRFTWNASASAPIGLYRLTPDSHPSVGDLVAIAPPKALAEFMAKRRYLPIGVPLLKHVAAVPGTRVCRRGGQISIDGRPSVLARKLDGRGRLLPVWNGCRTLNADELFLLNCAPDSLDGRYFGPLPAHDLIGRAFPILTRATPDARLVWRGLGGRPSSPQQKKGQMSCS